MICPCKDCQDRKIGCHSSCIKYKEFHEEREEIREVKALERVSSTYIRKWPRRH